MTDRGYAIRPARPQDVDAVAPLWRQMADEHTGYAEQRWDWAPDAEARWRAFFERACADERSVVLVADDPNAGVIGYALGAVRENSPVFRVRTKGEVFDLAVGSEHRGRGVGSALIDAVADAFVARGAGEMVLIAAHANLCARRFYEQRGLKPVAVQMYRRLP